MDNKVTETELRQRLEELGYSLNRLIATTRPINTQARPLRVNTQTKTVYTVRDKKSGEIVAGENDDLSLEGVAKFLDEAIARAKAEDGE